MSQANEPIESKARLAGRATGAVFRVAIQAATVLMALGYLSDQIESVVLTLLWIQAPLIFFFLGVPLYIRLNSSAIRHKSFEDLTGYLFYLVSRDPGRSILFSMFLIALFAYGQTALGLLNATNLVLGFFSRVYPKTPSESGRP